MSLVTSAATFVLDGLAHPSPMKATSQPAPGRRYRVELITAESEASLLVRHRRLIRFPQLTMPLLAAWTPDHWDWLTNTCAACFLVDSTVHQPPFFPSASSAVAGALMPDAHVGYGLPIGGVLATPGVWCL